MKQETNRWAETEPCCYFETWKAEHCKAIELDTSALRMEITAQNQQLWMAGFNRGRWYEQERILQTIADMPGGVGPEWIVNKIKGE